MDFSPDEEEGEEEEGLLLLQHKDPELPQQGPSAGTGRQKIPCNTPFYKKVSSYCTQDIYLTFKAWR